MATASRAIIHADRLSDQVYSLLRNDLLCGEFEPGERLVEQELAARYQVSRTPVRQALVQLSRDGMLVDIERGFAAPSITTQDITRCFEVKWLLEPRLAELMLASAVVV
ncbi:GntR family transcriptional regulator [Novosphingobium album (ex Liu et al. 2023)]|uniref:GntR family transcriptional regulator n=1 Tax=Novosphingobium album (ex Liu et al. 2023) TaxID=3031130 RepID=A0ABT5WX40_9SPHN|nr:GntR family transcriptional regulator [Novosphingobium album (ex Liu et al. 2023)]MDE8654446.1 GntR family transcriptional regulator [Novosphingobium album (ex Liu et al. 2023)]